MVTMVTDHFHTFIDAFPWGKDHVLLLCLSSTQISDDTFRVAAELCGKTRLGKALWGHISF